VGAVATGGDFWKGATIGAMVGALNHAMEMKQEDIQDEINVLKESDWQTQAPDWKGCFRTCCRIIGGKPSLSNAIYTASEEGGDLVILSDAKLGVKTIDSYLKQGKPIIVGVNFKPGSPNADLTTDHYVVIMGSGKVNGKQFYRFFEVGTTRISAGTSPLNRFYLNSNYSLSGVTQYNTSRFYTVSQVRKF
jgi:hypothetical protein